MTIDLMIDIETLGKGPGFAVLSAAILPFRLNGKPVEEDEVKPLVTGINLGETLSKGMKVNHETLDWWSKNDPEVIRQQFRSINSLNDFIDDIVELMEKVDQKYTAYTVWASAPKLDFGCLYYAFVCAGRESEWPFLYSSERCYRTLRALCNTIHPTVEKGIKLTEKPNHDPLQDCRVQVVRAQAYYKALRNDPEPVVSHALKDAALQRTIEVFEDEQLQKIKPVSIMASDKEVNDAIAPSGEDQHW